MADTGNIEFIAAKVSSIERSLVAANDARLDSFRDLLSSIESALGDLVGNIEQGGGAQAIEAMAKALGSIRMPEINFTAPAIAVNVPQQAAPHVNVQVNPTPITVEAVMPPMPAMPAPVIHIMQPEKKAAKFKVTVHGVGYNASDRTMTIEQVN